MRVASFGEGAVVIDGLTDDSGPAPHRIATAIGRAGLDGVEDVVPGRRSVVVVFDALATSGEEVTAGLVALLPALRAPEDGGDGSGGGPPDEVVVDV
ncbi:MAG TPA: carboxyltransferase domain-containing protein, partial [Acidimicrobiales bacterium]|nr:carboxyltransferase domain-containing protein [Acidimicrobiales bacterium]